MRRRSFLAAPLLLGLPAWAGTRARRFVFVTAPGGWDVTRVYAPAFDNEAVAMEATAARWQAGGLSLVDHPDRPSVRAFFEAWHARSIVLQGMLVRSIAHEICFPVLLTGDTSGTRPDWATLLGDAARDQYAVPHLVLGGPAFPGDRAVAVGRTGSGGQLGRLLDGTAAGAGQPSAAQEAVLDAFVAARAQARAARSPLERAVAEATGFAARLKAAAPGLDFAAGTTLEDRCGLAVRALGAGISRCVTLAAEPVPMGWDTHVDNDLQQSYLYEELYRALGGLVEDLEATPAPEGGVLADSTLVVVWSELGRTPALNSFGGKDHWPYTSALLVGKGLQGSREIGGYDEGFQGKLIDPVSGELDDGGTTLSAEMLGATLLAWGDVDPGPHVDAEGLVL